MDTNEIDQIIENCLDLHHETNIVEFKSNLNKPEKIAEYIVGLSNTTILENHDEAFMIWGVEDETYEVIGTNFDPWKKKWKGNQDLIIGLNQNIDPKPDFDFFETIFHNKRIILLQIRRPSYPLSLNAKRYIRVDSHLVSLKDYPDKEKRIFENLQSPKKDWSGQIVTGATLDDLCPDAISFARERFKKTLEKRDSVDKDNIDNWDNITFLNKALITKQGKMTNCALLLLGKEEANHFLDTVDAKISWVLYDADGNRKSHQHYRIPFLNSVNFVFNKIRNEHIEYMPNNTLFPDSVKQYDEWVIREILHNCIAHQDYYKGGRIHISEHPDKLIFENIAQFIPKNVEAMLEAQSPPEHYRNKFLVDAMINLGMVEQLGSGIRRSFQIQRDRYFPMPDYDVSNNKVNVTLHGKILDIEYTKSIMIHKEIDFFDIVALDKVQKKLSLSNEIIKRLKKNKLIEGRKPNLHISSTVAMLADKKAEYIKTRSLDDEYYKKLIKEYIEKFSHASRQDIDKFIIPKLGDTLDDYQKKRKVGNLITSMRRGGFITNKGSDRYPKWVMVKSAE